MFHFIGNESTLFVVLIESRFEHVRISEEFFICEQIIQECLREKLPLIPQTKVVIIDDSLTMKNLREIAPETLQVCLPGRVSLGTMLELLNKRYKSLDLIAVMLELRRSHLTAYRKDPYHHGFWYSAEEVDVRENLSCLPRLQKTEQM